MIFYRKPSCTVYSFITIALFFSAKTRKPDRYRQPNTEEQNKILEAEYAKNKFLIDLERRKELSKEIHLTQRQIKIWFQNRRAAERRAKKRELLKRQALCNGAVSFHIPMDNMVSHN